MFLSQEEQDWQVAMQEICESRCERRANAALEAAERTLDHFDEWEEEVHDRGFRI